MSGTVTLNGVATEDAELSYTLDGSGTVSSQQWESSADGSDWTPIDGATEATFTPGDDEVGDLLRVVVEVEDGGTTSSVESDASDAVANVNDEPGGALAIGGTAREGETLTLTDEVTDADGIADDGRSYQWQVQGTGGVWTDIDGATNAEFTPTDAEVGSAVRAVLSYTDDQGEDETVTSAATAAVGEPNILPEGAVTVSGTATQGQTLTATNDVTDADGIPAGGGTYR